MTINNDRPGSPPPLTEERLREILRPAPRTIALALMIALRRSSLGSTASELLRLQRSHEEGRSADAGFDAGEFSGPAHDRMLEQESRAVLAKAGWTPEGFRSEVIARTSERWLYHNPLSSLLSMDME